jgi:hypothetical protein
LDILNVVVEPAATNRIKIYYQNYLENAVISCTSEEMTYPKYRLYDRAQGLLFKGSSHPNPFQLIFDLGASGPYPLIDAFILGKNHNFTGLTLELYYSDGGGWTLVTSWVATAGINRKISTGSQHRNWILSIIAPASNPEIGEIFLTKQSAFDRQPNLGYEHGDEKNQNRLLSKSGMAQKTKWGERKKARTYSLTNISDAQRIEFELWDTVTDGTKNFYIEDLQGNLFLAELPDGLPKFRAERGGRWGIDLSVLEVLD